MDVTISEGRTKNGKVARVAVIPATLVSDEGPERMHWRATAIAQDHECSHYRIVGANGSVVASGKAGALATQEQTARLHGDTSDWTRD